VPTVTDIHTVWLYKPSPWPVTTSTSTPWYPFGKLATVTEYQTFTIVPSTTSYMTPLVRARALQTSAAGFEDRVAEVEAREAAVNPDATVVNGDGSETELVTRRPRAMALPPAYMEKLMANAGGVTPKEYMDKLMAQAEEAEKEFEAWDGKGTFEMELVL
jgi:hypothetical protein